MPKVVGIDPSLTGTGLAAIDTINYPAEPIVRLETVGHSLKRTASFGEHVLRMQHVQFSAVEFAVVNDADLVVIEGLSFGSKGRATRDLAGLWWSIVIELAACHIDVLQVSPTQRAKYATGNGRADKREVSAAVLDTYGAQFGSEVLLSNDNEADALVLAAMGARVLGEPVDAGSLSDRHLEPMGALQEVAAW